MVKYFFEQSVAKKLDQYKLYKAYSKILNLNYVQAKYALKNKRNLIVSGNACEIKEILYKLKQFKVHYEINPPYPYE